MHLFCNGRRARAVQSAPARWGNRPQACGSSVLTLLVAVLLCAAAPVLAAEKLLALAVSVNGAPGGTWVLLERDGRLYAPAGAFKEWRLSSQRAGASIVQRGRTWRDLTPIPGYRAEFNLADQSVALTFAPAEFEASTLGHAYRRAQLGPVLPALFLNYDLAYQDTNLRGVGRRRDLGALTELGWSGAAGVLSSTAVARELEHGKDWTRLETSFRADAPERNLTLIAGDSSTRAGMLGHSVYFGGLQFGRNYALSPGMAVYPQPLLAGQSAAPSTLELYVDGVLRETVRAPAGPFSIDALPALTGAGDVRLVVRDQLGRETILQDSFHAVRELLAPGLIDFSVQAGRLRERLGSASNEYGAAFGSGLVRYGFTRHLTVELRGEASRATSGAGAGLTLALPWQMIGSAAIAASDERDAGTGQRTVLELTRPSVRHNFSLRREKNSGAWREIGLPGASPFTRVDSVRYGTRGAGGWYAGLAFTKIQTVTDRTLETLSANATLRLSRGSSLTFTGSSLRGAGVSVQAIGLSLSLALDGAMVNTGITERASGTDAYASVSRNPGVGLGLGGSATVGRRAGERYVEGGAFWQGEHALVTGQAHAGGDNASARLGLQGAVVASDSTVFFTPALRGSFAVIEAGAPGVAVQLHGAARTRTGSDGKALVSGLLPYRANRVRLDANDLPIAAELDTIEHEAVPRSRSGVKLTFAIRPGRAALLVLSLPDGAPAPFGATLSVAGQEFYVGGRGRVFVTGAEPGAIARLAWKDGSCSVALELPAGEEVPTVALQCR